MRLISRRASYARPVVVGIALLVGGGLASCGADRAIGGSETAGLDSGANDAASQVDDSGSTTPREPVGDPDDFAKGEVDVVSIVRTAEDRQPISPLIYGLNEHTLIGVPAGVLAGVTFIRRGGDRANAYNWETNVSNGGWENAWSSDLYLASGLGDSHAPAGVDLALITQDRASGRGTMVPFVLNDYVAGPVSANIPYDDANGWDRSAYFQRVNIVKPTGFAATPNLNDGTVYTDEQFAFMKSKFPEDIYAPGASQVMVGIDNEPDLWSYNFPMLQAGSGAALYADNGTQIGTLVDGTEFTGRFLQFAKRIKQLEPSAKIVGPSHYHFDGWTSWHGTMPEYSSSGDGHWYMDDFLAAVKTAGEATNQRLLDTWDFHWYPQPKKDGTFVWALDDSVRPLTPDEIDAIIQGPRSYWDHDYDEGSWITRDHLMAPAWIIERLQKRIAAAYPGTHLGVSEYFPGGCAHVSSGLAVADSLGVFARMGVHLAAMWPTCSRLEFAYGALELLRNADGKGARFADTVVHVEHPEKVESSLYAGSDDDKRVTVLVINKTNADRRIGIRFFHDAKLTNVDVHRIDAAHSDPYLAMHGALTKKNAFAYAAPPMSASMLVFSAP
jgi:hypothetical protein